MKYLFVLGRNPKLSSAEIFAWIEKEGLGFERYELRENALLIECGELDAKKAINELGGCVAIGRIMFSGNRKEVIEKIKKEQIYKRREIKAVYSVLNYADGEYFDEVLDAVKYNLAKEGLKARYKAVGGTIEMQSGEIIHGSPEKIMLRDVNYFVFEGKEVCFGALEESYNVKEAEKKDIGKPERRERLAISPRLARILINLSEVKNGERILDPFCGIGVILHEALLRGINATGIDADALAVKDAKKNIDWLRQNYKFDSRYALRQGDSRKIMLEENDICGIATEPSLGKLLTISPSKEEAVRMLSVFEKLMVDVINNIKRFVRKGAKIAFTAPLIRTSDKKRIGCSIEKICERTGLQVYELRGVDSVKFPIPEFRSDQIVGREFFVLEV